MFVVSNNQTIIKFGKTKEALDVLDVDCGCLVNHCINFSKIFFDTFSSNYKTHLPNFYHVRKIVCDLDLRACFL